jgi:diguanylate cyclase (GGDEF)-like protein/PAS domain S-box-containing protein
MHVQTLFLVNFALSLVVGITLLSAAKQRYAAIRTWAAAMAMHALGYGLIGLRGTIPDFTSIVVGNTALAIYLSLLATGVYRYQQRPAPHWLLWAPVPVTFLGFLLLFNDLGGRILLSSVLVSLQIILTLLPLATHRRQIAGLGQYMVMSGLVIDLACLAARIVHALREPAPSSLFDSNVFYSMILFGNLLALLLIMAGLLLMVHERTLNKLQQSEGRYRQLIESAQEGICILSQGRYIFVNPRMAELLGVSADALLNSPFTDFIHPDDRSSALAKYASRVAGAADGQVHDIRLLTAHAGSRWFRVSGLRIQWHGQPATLNFLSDIHERKLAEERTRQLAYHDELTQLPNRRLFTERLAACLGDDNHDRRHIGVMFIDVNKLKALNDQYGHQAGDLLLIEVSHRLQQHVGEADTVARLGGDEFVVLLPSLSGDHRQARQQAMKLAEHILATLSAPYHLKPSTNDLDTIVFNGSASIGVHVFDNRQIHADEILNKADAAMYQAKKAGQGVLFFDDQIAA